jgi:transcriptional regulator GlxA family with amidase domain
MTFLKDFARRSVLTTSLITATMASRLDRITDWDRLATESRFRVAALADACDVTERQLRRYFQATFGCSPHTWMSARRLQKVHLLLRHGRLVKEVAASAGFAHQSSFARRFKQQYSVSPSASRRWACCPFRLMNVRIC